MKSPTLRFLARRWPRHAGELGVVVSPISGGLESTVGRIDLRPRLRTRSPVPRSLIVKELRGRQRREDTVYRMLWREGRRPPAARWFGSLHEADTCYLYIEKVPTQSLWPWRDTESSAAVCRALARLHRATQPPADLIPTWNYEQELACSALRTLDLATTVRDADGSRSWTRPGDLQRVVAELPRIRNELIANGVTFIHGDVHPGNVMVTTRGRVVFIDWARARLGSPLEDIASWLHSLGCWEPDARRRHDTLLRIYLRESHLPDQLGPALRRQYWFACLSNGLSGAIAYHLSVLGDAASAEPKRSDSRQALQAWQRVVRRGATLLSKPPPTTR